MMKRGKIVFGIFIGIVMMLVIYRFYNISKKDVCNELVDLYIYELSDSINELDNQGVDVTRTLLIRISEKAKFLARLCAYNSSEDRNILSLGDLFGDINLQIEEIEITNANDQELEEIVYDLNEINLVFKKGLAVRGEEDKIQYSIIVEEFLKLTTKLQDNMIIDRFMIHQKRD